MPLFSPAGACFVAPSIPGEVDYNNLPYASGFVPVRTQRAVGAYGRLSIPAGGGASR